MYKITTLITMLAIASVASAATDGSATQGQVTVSWTPSVAPNGMDLYFVTLSSADGVGLIQAYGGSFTGAAINQLLVAGQPVVFYPPPGWDPLLGPDLSSDSHYLVSSTAVLPISGTAMESATSLEATFGIPGGIERQTQLLAQIVVPTGQSFLASGDAAIYGLDNYFDVTIPEPATMGLLAFGGLGLLRRRKR